MAKKTKLQQGICDFFRYLSFVLAVFTLGTFISSTWFEWPEKAVVFKALITTGAALATSVVTMLIFMDWDEGEGEVEDKKKSDFDA